MNGRERTQQIRYWSITSSALGKHDPQTIRLFSTARS
jgi:hypothetical protein